MARNAPAAYGSTLREDSFDVVTGAEGVALDAMHRLTNETVLGPGGEEWGLDVRRWSGMPADRLPRMAPIVSEVLQRDERILTADVEIVATDPDAAGLVFATMTIDCTTAPGPFRRVFSLASASLTDITNILEGET